MTPFWQNIEIGGPTGCWVWTAGHTAKGYGTMSTEGRTIYAHRFAYEQLKGPIPAELTIDHLCRNRACVNPDHLEPVGRGENVRRGTRLRTHCKRGHAFDENAVIYRTWRICVRCREYWREKYRKDRLQRLGT